MLLLGIDIGSSSIKTTVLCGETGINIASSFYPQSEMQIDASKPGWAEQKPEMWWDNLKLSVQEVLSSPQVCAEKIGAIGITYQMHGLVAVDRDRKPVRSSIIWCDSRAVNTGSKAFSDLGEDLCLSHLLNSPGNFTASKLKWVKENESELYEKIYKIMLPGDYINMKLTGEINTTVTGLSEGMFWDFKENSTADFLLEYYGIDKELLPTVVPVFGEQGRVVKSVAEELGIPEGIPVAYRSGDQPNNAFSLNVLNPGEIATTAGTSGVVYGVSEKVAYDPESRVNTFAHVNHSTDKNRLGVLLCINGTGIQNSWMQKNVGVKNHTYEQMNQLAVKTPIGAEGLSVLPFGNGAERVLGNRNIGAHFSGVNFNVHSHSYLFRACQEGIGFAFKYGMDIMKTVGIEASVIKAGFANMFMSPLFSECLANVSEVNIELYNTDGAQGAARGAGLGAGFFNHMSEVHHGLKIIKVIEPSSQLVNQYQDAFQNWLVSLNRIITAGV